MHHAPSWPQFTYKRLIIHLAAKWIEKGGVGWGITIILYSIEMILTLPSTLQQMILEFWFDFMRSMSDHVIIFLRERSLGSSEDASEAF